MSTVNLVDSQPAVSKEVPEKKQSQRWKKVLAWSFAAPFALIGGLVLFALMTHDRQVDVPTPAIQLSKEPAVLKRGEYLVYGPAHCAVCHTKKEDHEKVLAGEKIPLTGGYEMTIPPGTYVSANLTPDKFTGIGKMSPGEVARVLRHGVNRDGEVMIPLMDMPELSDEDLTAIVSFLFSQEPVRKKQPKSEWTLLGKLVRSLALKPYGLESTPPKSVPRAATVEYGDYLANDLARCVMCHTERNIKTGEYVGKPFAGGFRMPIMDDPTIVLVTPNLTSHETGMLSRLDEDAFLKRLRGRPSHHLSPMPWGPYGRMSDDDLRAIYRYLKSLDPVDNDPGPVVQDAD